MWKNVVTSKKAGRYGRSAYNIIRCVLIFSCGLFLSDLMAMAVAGQSTYSTFITMTRMVWSSVSLFTFAICQSPGKKMKNLSGVES